MNVKLIEEDVFHINSTNKIKFEVTPTFDDSLLSTVSLCAHHRSGKVWKGKKTKLEFNIDQENRQLKANVQTLFTATTFSSDYIFMIPLRKYKFKTLKGVIFNIYISLEDIEKRSSSRMGIANPMQSGYLAYLVGLAKVKIDIIAHKNNYR